MEQKYEGREFPCCGTPRIIFGSFVGQVVPRNGIGLGPYPIAPSEDELETAYREMGD